jgi:hypothetical protein
VAPRLSQVMARLDQINAEDPRRDEVTGEPYELAYAGRMSEWLARLEPGASEPLQLAVRAQHIARWRLPREGFPEGRAGYKRWRSECARLHAEVAGEVLREAGYQPDTVDRVGALLRKQGLRTDPEAQLLEDVACLVFLEHYFADFASKHERDKLVDIVRKTWGKMSARGHAAALELAPQLAPELRAIVEEALRPAGPPAP